MSAPDPHTNEEVRLSPSIDLPRVGLVAATAGAILAALLLGSSFASSNGFDSTLFGYGFLVIVPFVATLVFGALFRVYWGVGADRGNLLASVISIALVLVAVLTLLATPFLICMAIAAPIWLISAIAGGVASRWLVKRAPQTQLVLILSLLVATGVVLVLEPRAGYPTKQYVVSRSVVIDASAAKIWPHLLKLDNLAPEDQTWTFSQDILGIPRPVDAVVHGEGVGAVRKARWQRGVWFEEHITNWKPNESLTWDFVFPDDSTFSSVDQHIDPRGPNLIVQTGGYKLAQLSNGSTRLDLFTTYSASTAVNAYSALWGELVVGDVQNNILNVVKLRAERSDVSPEPSHSLIAAN